MAVASTRFRAHRLIYLPVLLSLLGIWAALAWYARNERANSLSDTRAQLASTIATLADFNELAEGAGANLSSEAAGARRAAAIWRALLQYPSASIWVEKQGAVIAGEVPAASSAPQLLVDEIREGFAVHMSMSEADALLEWQRDTKSAVIALLVLSAGFLILTKLLSRTMRERGDTQRDALVAQERANERLESELVERKAAQEELREHDALLKVVTTSAAELLGSHQEESISSVFALVGATLGVQRVQLNRISTAIDSKLHWLPAYEWCAEGSAPLIDHPAMQNIDLNEYLDGALPPLLAGDTVSLFIGAAGEKYVPLFEKQQMRSFLQIPVQVAGQLWGALYFIDAALEQRNWSWAETDTLKTLANLIGVAIGRSQYVRELADANMIVQNSPTLLYRLRGEPSLPLIYVSHNITKFGHDPVKLMASPNWAREIVDPQDVAKVSAAMARVLEKDAESSTIEFRLRTGDGTFRWVENRYTPIRGKDGRLSEVEGIIIDITERKAAEDKIAQLARTDGLTNLANRATFTERLRQSYAATRRGAGAFAILYIDLDHFKDVNDTLGHPVGDMLLCEVAERLRALTRETDLVARLGGDEFAVLQTEMGDPANAGELADKIQKSLAQTYFLDGNDVHVSASIGVCPYVAGSTGPDSMLAQADLALYRSKDEGRNQWHFHTEDLDQEVLQRVAMSEELRAALERNELALFYQPQVEVATGGIVGMEALVRWNHPARGLLSASAFIPVAEKAGLMIPLGHWVLDQACRQMREWQIEGVAPPVVSINLSLSQLKKSGELVSDVANTTAKYGLRPEHLEFDVTEATLAQATLMQNDVLAELIKLGTRIAIADFGTEYSSFDYLRSYNVSHLKIAQSFISDAITDPERAATIRAIISIARELDIGVIAEGVETEAQRALLASTGAMTCAQGFYFSEAVDAQRANELLRTGHMPAAPAPVEGAAVDALLSATRR
jgi:diguanylate cyclase (GGDEF)-like protein/PAS domain S-box-containing protein